MGNAGGQRADWLEEIVSRQDQFSAPQLIASSKKYLPLL